MTAAKQTQGTPGPWAVAVAHGEARLVGSDKEFSDADARLIAAAPELLAENKALREALERFANMDKVGMGNPRLDTIRHAFMVALPEYIGWCKQARAALSKARP